MNFLSVCSGIEAASVAWNPLGWRACMVSEIEPFPISVLRHRHGAHDLRRARPAGSHLPLWGDFTALRVRHFRRFGIPLPQWLVGGTPCQAFSIAGQRGSLNDARGNLSLAFIRLAHALASTGSLRGLLWENVPGVLSTRDNAFGCFLGELVGGGAPLPPPNGGSWPRAGLVSGPRARAAWRVLDAQYFGLAQRRERVFVVGSFGNGPDPAAVLFERQGLRGNLAPRREAGTRPAASLGASAGGSDDNDGRGGHLIASLHADAINRSGDAGAGIATPGIGIAGSDEAMFTLNASAVHGIAFGGNDTRGPIDVATALNAHGGPTNRLDFESETFVEAPPLTSNPYGDHESREGLLVACEVADTLTVGKNQTTGFHGEVVATLDASYGRLQGCSGQDAKHGHSHLVPVAFSCKDHGADAGDLAPTLRSMGHDRSHANAGGQIAVAFHENQRGELTTSETHAALSSGGGKPGQGYASAATPSGVRRLMPRECERLQGFPDDYTLVPHRGKPAADGPRYKALGNSKAVPVVRWIGARIDLALAGDAA